MSRMSESAGRGDEALLLGVAAGDEARVLPRVEVLRHRRRHHDDGGEGVLERRLPLLGRLVELLRVLDEVGRGGEQEVGVRAAPRGTSTLPSPSRSGSTPLATNFGSVPKTEVSTSAKKLPGCLYFLPALVLSVERDRVLGVGAVGAGVDDHVVVGERRDAGDDALHLLVGRVGLDVRALELLDRRLDLLAVLLEQLRVVEVRRLREVVVLLRVALEQLDRGDQAVGVLEQVGLDRVEVAPRRRRSASPSRPCRTYRRRRRSRRARRSRGREGSGNGAWLQKVVLGCPNSLGAPNC